MPLKTIDRDSWLTDSTQQLRKKIVLEWKHNTRNPNNPIILIDKSSSLGDSVHIYVVWDKWGDLDQEVRSEIIMSACEEVGKENILDVTVAMGLTKEEADRMKVPYK